MSDQPHLQIRDLRTFFFDKERQAFVRSVNGVNLDVARGETLGVVGESGSGKSITMLSVMGLIGANPGVIQGDVTLQTEGGRRDLLAGLDDYVSVDEQGSRLKITKDAAGWQRHVETLMQGIRGKELGMIFQNPKAALNPYETVGRQISEMIRLHTPIDSRREARERAIEWLARVKIDAPAERYDNFPYGLSGGMCQRAMIALALSAEPSLLIADEPTTGLDATIQAEVIELLVQLKAELGITLVLISHDISVISRLADRVAVMYGGQVVEHGPADTVLSSSAPAKHPYTRALLTSVPGRGNVDANGRLRAIQGEVPDILDAPAGCRFRPRCSELNEAVRERCGGQTPELTEVAPGHCIRCWLQD